MSEKDQQPSRNGPNEKPISLYPLSTEQALRQILNAGKPGSRNQQQGKGEKPKGGEADRQK